MRSFRSSSVRSSSYSAAQGPFKKNIQWKPVKVVPYLRKCSMSAKYSSFSSLVLFRPLSRDCARVSRARTRSWLVPVIIRNYKRPSPFGLNLGQVRPYHSSDAGPWTLDSFNARDGQLHASGCLVCQLRFRGPALRSVFASVPREGGTDCCSASANEEPAFVLMMAPATDAGWRIKI